MQNKDRMPYDEKSIREAIHTKWAGNTVHFAQEIDSTNTWIRTLAAEGGVHGTLAVADFQSAGRGRFDRSWKAPSGGAITMTILLRPDFAPQFAPMLTLVMGLSVAQAVREMNFDVSIKWPNDVVISHKKICGILTEMRIASDGAIDFVEIGTGINVNLPEFPEEVRDKATSLLLEGGQEYDRSQVIGGVMKYFEENYERFIRTCDFSLLLPEYHTLLANMDQPVRVLCEEPYEGICRGINDQGELLVETEENGLQVVNAGEVSVRGLYSYV